jgi:hypothetical protein
VDACGYEVVTVHSGFYPSADAALAAWQQAVGPSAAEATHPDDDTDTLDALLTGELEGTRPGVDRCLAASGGRTWAGPWS